MQKMPHMVEWLQKRRVWLARLVLVPVLLYLFAWQRIGIVPIYEDQAIWSIFTIILGILIRSLSAGALHKNSSLSTNGIYAMVRNPLYVGSFLVLIGFCFIINDFIFWITALTLFAVTYIPTILSEERGLQQAFPEQWSEFTGSTPRFIPNVLRLGELRNQKWSAQQWYRNHEHNSIIAAILMLIFLEFYNRYWALQ